MTVLADGLGGDVGKLGTTPTAELPPNRPADLEVGLSKASEEHGPDATNQLALTLSFSDLPPELSVLLHRLANPKESSFKGFVKDYLPSVTSVAAVVISALVWFYGNQFNERAATAARADTYSKIVETFAKHTITDAAKVPSSQDALDDINKKRVNLLAAMEFAAHGDAALPAVKLVLGSDDRDIRAGGVLVGQQMYRAETVDRSKLFREMLSYYDNNWLRRGVLEWLIAVSSDLSAAEAAQALDAIKKQFGDTGKECTKQDSEVARVAANFLFIRHPAESIALAEGMIANCIDDQTNKFDVARAQAVTALVAIAREFPNERKQILAWLSRVTGTQRIDNVIKSAVSQIQLMDPR